MYTLRFSIPYYMTHEGGHVVADLYLRNEDGSAKPYLLVSLSPLIGSDSSLWEGSTEIDNVNLSRLVYRYRACNESGTPIHVEPGLHHRVPDVKANQGTIRLDDLWAEPSAEHIMGNKKLRSLFFPRQKGVYYSNNMPPLTPSDPLYHLHKPLPYPGDLIVVGNDPLLGSWRPEYGLYVDPDSEGDYYFRCPLSQEQSEYKFALKLDDGSVVWEDGGNRMVSKWGTDDMVMKTLIPPHFPDVPITRPYSGQIEGAAVPLFSLRSSASWGCGDFSDAVRFIEWQSKVGQHVLQLLPIYDTRFNEDLSDAYPYNATTTFGIHPLYLDVTKLPYYEDSPKVTRQCWERKANELNALEAVSYTEVIALKLEVARYSFRRYMERADLDIIEDFRGLFGKLYDEVEEEMEGYAFFCSFREKLKGVPVAEWPPYNPESFDKDEEYYFALYLQLQLYKQLHTLSKRASDLDCLLKGDLPIGIGRNSADAWMHPGHFNFDLQAGSPPDAFSSEGQNWSFPTYNWSRMAQDGYAWWRRRFTFMAHFFQLMRIDHILGFFRIFSIPSENSYPRHGYYQPALGYQEWEVGRVKTYFSQDKEGLYHPHLSPENEIGFAELSDEERGLILYYRDEYYYHRNEDLWQITAMERISNVLVGTSMIVCAEDLGVLPKSMKDVLHEFDILSLEVVRMSKVLGKPFVYPEDIPLLSVLTTSTHDTSTIREWWNEEITPETQSELTSHYGVSPKLSDLITALRHQHNLFLILPLQDWMALWGHNNSIHPKSERINVPSDPNNPWNYRMFGDIESLPLPNRR